MDVRRTAADKRIKCSIVYIVWLCVCVCGYVVERFTLDDPMWKRNCAQRCKKTSEEAIGQSQRHPIPFSSDYGIAQLPAI